MLVLHLTGRLASDGSKNCALRKLDHDDREQAKRESLAWTREICEGFAAAQPARLRDNETACEFCGWNEPLVENDVKFLQAAVSGSRQKDGEGWTIIQHPDGSIWAWSGDDEEFEIDIV